MRIKFPRRENKFAPIPPAGLQQMLDRAPAAGHSDLRIALTLLGEAYSKVHDSASRFQHDATITPAARTVKSARAARMLLTPAIERLHKARATAAEGRAHIQQQMDKLFEYASFPDTMIAAEIRSHFASSPPEARYAELQRASEAGDLVTLKALGAGPAYLAGIEPRMHKELVRDRVVALHPEAAANRDAATAFDEQAQLATMLEDTVMHGVAELVDFEQADSFEAVAQEAVAA